MSDSSPPKRSRDHCVGDRLSKLVSWEEEDEDSEPAESEPAERPGVRGAEPWDDDDRGDVETAVEGERA